MDLNPLIVSLSSVFISSRQTLFQRPWDCQSVSPLFNRTISRSRATLRPMRADTSQFILANTHVPLCADPREFRVAAINRSTSLSLRTGTRNRNQQTGRCLQAASGTIPLKHPFSRNRETPCFRETKPRPLCMHHGIHFQIFSFQPFNFTPPPQTLPPPDPDTSPARAGSAPPRVSQGC